MRFNRSRCMAPAGARRGDDHPSSHKPGAPFVTACNPIFDRLAAVIMYVLNVANILSS